MAKKKSGLHSRHTVFTGRFPVKTVCRAMRVARSTVHRQKGRPPTWQDGRRKKKVDDQDITPAVNVLGKVGLGIPFGSVATRTPL